MPKLKQVVPVTAPEMLHLNAGIIAHGMTIDTIKSAITSGILVIPQENILGLTSGGLTITCVPNFIDLGSDVDGLKENVDVMQYISSYDTGVAGTMVTASDNEVKLMVGNADIDTTTAGVSKITPKEGFVDASNFKTIHVLGQKGPDEIWIVELNKGLNKGGFSKKTTDKEKSTFDVEFKGHYEIAELDKCPMAFYNLKEVSSSQEPTE